MAIVETIGGVLGLFSTSGLLGGITGIIGNELKSRRELKLLELKGKMEEAAWPERQKERDHDLAMRAGNYEHELKLHEVNARATAEENARAIMALETEFSGQGLGKAIDADAKLENAPPWVDAVRALTRPAISYTLIALMAAIYFFSPAPVKEIVAAAVVYMATVAVLFWFGDRPSSRMRNMLLNMNDGKQA